MEALAGQKGDEMRRGEGRALDRSRARNTGRLPVEGMVDSHLQVFRCCCQWDLEVDAMTLCPGAD